MGLPAPMMEIMMMEHKHRPFTGKALFIGRQAVYATAARLVQMLRKYNLPIYEIPPEIDSQTINNSYSRHITDRYFMKMLGVHDLSFMDVSDYEGAEIVHDLGVPVPEELHGQFDFIYNGSCLDNMFNPAQALFNMSAMLKPGGRLICAEHSTPYHGPYVMYSPAYFYDYFVVNSYKDCKVYVCGFTDSNTLGFGPWEIYYFDWSQYPFGAAPAPTTLQFITVTIAEKDALSTNTIQPIQAIYRTQNQQETYEKIQGRFNDSSRPLIKTQMESPCPPIENYTSLGMLTGVSQI